MKIVIDISENMIEEIENNRFGKDKNDSIILAYAVMRRITLPKGHGRLIDADKTLEVAWQEFYKHEEEWEEKDEDYLPLHRFYDQNGFECCQQTIVNAPTIVEADKEAE